MTPREAEVAVEAAGKGSVAELLGDEPCPTWCSLQHGALEGRGWEIDSTGPVRWHEVCLPSPPGVDLYARRAEVVHGELLEWRVGGIESRPLTADGCRELARALLRAADMVDAASDGESVSCPR